jgi:hypothetical protein
VTRITDALEVPEGVFVKGTGDDGVARDSRADPVTAMTAEESQVVGMNDVESSLLASGTVMVIMMSELTDVEVASERAVVVSGELSTLEP